MPTTLVPHHRAKHTADQIEATLVVLALESGNLMRARKKLAEMKVFDGEVPAAATIRRWPETYKDRYAEIREEVAPRIKAKLADTHTDLAARLAELESKTLDSLDAELADLTAKDRANLLRNAAVAGAIHQDKALLLRGEATQIVKRELPEIFRALAAKGVKVEGVIEGTAEEITPPELPRETDTDAPE